MPVLREHWDECFAALSLRAPAGVLESLVARYSEPHRAYHTLQHIGECFDQFSAMRNVDAPGQVGLALWFHDAIYDTHASDNEAKSAQLARTILAKAGAPESTIESIERLIMATKHDAVPEGRDAQILVDIDLSILGADPQRYREYEVQIRREYDWVEEIAFRNGRIRALQNFLDRSFIYSTADFRDRLEAPARSNLAREIASLA